MTFHQYFSGSSLDPVFSGSYDERFYNFQFPQNHYHTLYTLGSASPQNVDLNYYPISTWNVPYSSFYGQSCPQITQIPDANHAVMHNRIQTEPWTNVCNGEMSLPPPPDNCTLFLNSTVHDCYNVPRSFPLPDPVYSSCLQLDSDYHVGCNAGLNQQSCDTGFDNHGYVMVSPSQLQHHQCPAYPFQHKEIVNRGSGDFTVSHNYSIDEIMRNTVASSTMLTSEHENMFGIQSSLCDEHHMQQPTFGHCSPHKQQCASDQNLEANTRVRALPGITDYGAEVTCVSKSESISPQSLVEISSFPSARTLTDCALNIDEGVGYAECRSSPSGVMISSETETQEYQVDTISTTTHGFVCQPVPVMSQSREEPVTLTPPINTSDTQSTGAEGGQVLSPCSITLEQKVMDVSKVIVGSTDECEMPVKEDEQIGVSDVETSTSLTDAVAVSTSAASTTMEFRNGQLQADTSKTTQTISAINSALVIPSDVNVASTVSGHELMPEGIENAESRTVTGSSVDTVSNSSDDVIVLSPLPVADEPTAPVFANPENNAVKSYYLRRPPTCGVLEHQNTHRQLRSILRPVVPKSLPVRLPYAGSHTVGVHHHRSSPSVPPTNHNFSKLRNHDVPPSHAKRVTDQDYGIKTTSCQRCLPHNAVSSIATTSRRLSADITTCSSVKSMFCHPPITAVCGATREVLQHSSPKELERLLSLTPSALKDEISKPRICDSLEDSRRTLLQKSLHLLPASSRAVPQQGIAQHNVQKSVMSTTSASQNIHSISLGSLGSLSQMLRAVATNSKENECMKYRSNSLPVYRHENATLQLRQKTGMYSVKAAGTLLQHLKQAKLSDSLAPSQILRAVVGRNPKRNECMNYTSSSLPDCRNESSTLQLRQMSLGKTGTYSVRAAGTLLQQVKQAKLSDIASTRMARQQLLHRRLSLLSQKGQVIDLTGNDDGEAVADETCELIFARMRRRTASMPLLRWPRQYFYGPHYIAKCWRMKRTFAVDKSLPFYRCFVQNLLRSYRFSSSGMPVKVYSDVLPPAPPSISFASKGARSPAHGCTYDELLKKRQPVVLLNKLDQSFKNKNDAVEIKLSQDDVHEKCVPHVLSLSRDSSEKVHSGEFHIKDSGRQFDELISLCRPVSVVLERLDRNKINEICRKLRKIKPCCSDNQTIPQLGTELSVSDPEWTVTQRFRADKIPLLVIRTSTLSTQNATQKKMAKETSACPTRQLRSSFKRFRTRSCTSGIRHLHNLATDCSESRKNISQRRKLHFQSLTPKSLRTRNYIGHVLRCRSSAHTGRPPRQMSLKCRREQSQSTKLLAKQSEICSKSAQLFRKPEKLVTSVKQDVDLIPSDLASEKSLLADLLLHDLVVNKDVAEDCKSSDSDTVALSPRSSMDVNVTVDQDLHSVTSDLFQKNDLADDLLPYGSVFDVDLPEDCQSSDNNTVALSPHSSMDVNATVDQDLHSVASDSFQKNASSDIFDVDLPEDCLSSDSNTVALSPHSSIDDLTIAYRSPLSDVFDLDDPSLDQEDRLIWSLEAGSSSKNSDVTAANVYEVKTGSYADCSGVISQPNTTNVSESMQFSPDVVDSSTFSESLSCGLVNTEGQQSASVPLQLVGPVNDGLEKLAVSSSLSEFMNRDQQKSEMVASVSTA